MTDPTESIRRDLVNEINNNPNSRESLAKKYGKIWNTEELGQDFEVKSFMAPFVVVKQKSDGVVGILVFQHQPRFYFDFTPDKE